MISLVQTKLKKVILKKELKLAQQDDLYKWSTVQKWQAATDLQSLGQWSQKQMKNSEEFFSAPAAVVNNTNGFIEFDSPILTSHPENNRARGRYFQSPKAKAAVIILGHWNASEHTYNRLAKIYKLSGISALRLSLPYHDQRKPKEMPIASGLLSSDLSQTILGIRQATVDVKVAVDWLHQRGYEKIGLIGASLGSSIGLLSACHDSRINAMVLYLSAADTADLVWNSSATQHLRQSFEPDLTLESLRDVWGCISPSNYLHHLARPNFSMHIGWAHYDTVCPPELTQKMISTLRDLKVPVSESKYRCGHNTLATAPFMQLSGVKGLAFMRKNLKVPRRNAKLAAINN
ncbi:MAG: alpha/beta hydrolase family protein [Bdellovibrionota bacterium]